MNEPDDGKDMIGRPAGDEGSEYERDRLQSLLRAVLRLDLLLLLPTEPGDDDNDADDGEDDDDAKDDDDDDDEPDSLPNLVDQVRPLSPRRGFHQLGLLKSNIQSHIIKGGRICSIAND